MFSQILPDVHSTILALATPPGQSALAVIRMSGAESASILQACLARQVVLPPRVATLVDIVDAQGEALDHVMATHFPAPASYTGESVVELCCHGNMLIVQSLLQRLLSAGAIMATPGEFTQRAFLNGKMELTQAEAVMDVIHASSTHALRAAHAQLQGRIGRAVIELEQSLIQVLAHIEAHIDFPDEDIAPDSKAEILRDLTATLNIIDSLIDTSARGHVLRDGIKTAIVGAPNAGKSSLLNLLLGYERAIVTDTPGTTRDTIEESLHLHGLHLRLIDTAGIRTTADHIEQAGIDRSRAAMQAADLIIEIIDSSQPATPQFSSAAAAQRILVFNKCDLPQHPSLSGQMLGGISMNCLATSPHSGIEELISAIRMYFAQITQPQETTGMACINARHLHSLTQARISLTLGLELVQRDDLPELVSVEVRECLMHLQSIIGKVETNDLLDAIFSTFCLGK